MNEDIQHYANALIGATEAMLDRGALAVVGTDATREIIKRLREALAGTPPPVVVAVIRGGMIEEAYSNQPVTVLTIDHDTDGAEDSDLHTLPDGQQVLTSLTTTTISDLADYQPLLAHLAEPAATTTPATPGE